MNAYVLMFALGLLVPAPEPTPLTAEEVLGTVTELQGALSSFAVNLANLEPDAVNDMKVFGQVQRRRLQGMLVLLRCAEREFAALPSRQSRESLAEGCREMRAVIEKAAKGLEGFDAKDNAVDIARQVGKSALDGVTFRRFYRELSDFSKPSVGELVIPAP